MNSDGTTSISLPEIARELSPYGGVSLNESQLINIAKYLALLAKWNQTIPLTSIEEESEIVARHFGESMFAASLLRLERGRLADVGSGAGFPGLPLKIAFPDLQVTLVEPNLKKCAFLREVQAALSLTGIQIVRRRYEEFGPAANSFDFICSRALGAYRRLLRWSKEVVKPKGSVILWLGIDDSSLLTRTRGWHWELPVRIPESRRRVVLIGRSAS